MSRRVVPLLVAGLLAGCGQGTAPPPAGKSRGARGPMAFPVEAMKVESRAVEYSVSAIGSVEAFERVQITARVAGAVEKVLFVEGAAVRKGEPLVEIEPERYRLQVEQARATLEMAVAGEADARAGLQRREGVNGTSPGLIREEDIATWRTRASTGAAEVVQARASLELAKLNQRDAFVRAPVTGVVQTRTVQTGQYLQPGAVLATMVRRDPLLLRFQVPEPEAARLHAGQLARFNVQGAGSAFRAEIVHVAAAAESSSRMVQVMARVEGDDPALRPGAFAEVRVPVGARENAPVVPQTAVRPSERGFLAFVLEDGVARERVLTLGMRTEDGLVEVREGLTPGETVVVRGGEALREGAKVRVEAAEQAANQRGGEARPGNPPPPPEPATPFKASP